jgi:hypothetical protein
LEKEEREVVKKFLGSIAHDVRYERPTLASVNVALQHKDRDIATYCLITRPLKQLRMKNRPQFFVENPDFESDLIKWIFRTLWQGLEQVTFVVFPVLCVLIYFTLIT